MPGGVGTVRHASAACLPQGNRLAERVRILLFKAVLRQEVGFFDFEKNSSGAIASRLSADAVSVRGAVGDVMGVLVSSCS